MPTKILHAFGAPDLYYESTVIPKEFVDYCCQTGCNDIMFTVNEGETISSEFTPLDAYYVGIGRARQRRMNGASVRASMTQTES